MINFSFFIVCVIVDMLLEICDFCILYDFVLSGGLVEILSGIGSSIIYYWILLCRLFR